MESTKKMLRSLLTASPMAMTVQQLSKDYRNTIGEPIPYQRYGFNSLEHFLLSIPDTVQLQGSGPFALINLVISEKSSHVVDLVSRQKTERKRGLRYPTVRRRVVSSPRDFLKNYVPPNARPQSQRIVYPNIKPTYSSATSSVSNSSTNISNCRSFEYTFKPVDTTFEQQTTAEKEPELPQYTKNLIESSSVIHADTNNNANSEPVASITKKIEDMNISNRTMAPDIQKLTKSHMPNENKQISIPDEYNATSGRTKKLNLNKPQLIRDVVPLVQTENYVPVVIRNNLKLLIGKYPEGIWCAELPGVYRRLFKRELKYHDLGFRNLIDLCTSLKSIFHYVRPSTEDYKLYDRSKPLPASVEKIFTAASFSSNITFQDKDNTSALPSIDWSDVMVFLPPDIFKPGQEIPRTFVPETTQENDTIDIRMGEVFDVSKFWVYKDDGKLDGLMDEMQTFYGQDAEKYKIPKTLIREGLYCACVIFDEYHRALIIDASLPDSDEVRVFYIDYGTIKREKADLYFLHEHFASLPAQTIRCRLAGIWPSEKGAPWTRECTEEFRELIKRRDLTAKISRINWKDQYLEIFLADVTDNNAFYINDVLVEKGHAIFLDQTQKNSIIDSHSTPIVTLLHLFPTFLELEQGLAPSASEMETYYECNIPINFCYPQYFYTDHTKEENIIKHVTNFYETHILKGLRLDLHHYSNVNRTKLKEKPLDLSHFGELQDDIKEYWLKYNEGAEEMEENTIGEQIDENIVTITKKIEMWKTQTLNELKNDCLLSQDIMNDILNICQITSDSNPSSPCLDRDITTPSDDGSLLLKSFEDGDTSYCDEDDDDGGVYYERHPLNDLSFSRTSSLTSLEYPELFNNRSSRSDQMSVALSTRSGGTSSDKLQTAKLDEAHYLSASISDYLTESSKTDDENDEDLVTGENFEVGVLDKVVLKSTNPFLNDMVDEYESDIVGNNERLHPSNPFLTYIPETKEEQSDAGSTSTNSTSYGTCVEEIKIQRSWSQGDHQSMAMSISQRASFADLSPPVANLQSIEESNVDENNDVQIARAAPSIAATNMSQQLVQNNPIAIPPGFNVNSPEFYPQTYCPPLALPPFYPNPYQMPYNPLQFANPYYNIAQRQINSQLLMTSTITQTAQASAANQTQNFPPGFAPNSNLPISQTDFYESYNEMLRSRCNF